MDITIVLAQILGIIFVVTGVSIAINKKGVLSLLENSTHQAGVMWLCGFVVICFGAVLLALNHTWTSGLVSLISVLAWLFVLKGICLLWFPDFSVSMYRKWCGAGLLMLSGLLAFVLGLVLLYKGFI